MRISLNVGAVISQMDCNVILSRRASLNRGVLWGPGCEKKKNHIIRSFWGSPLSDRVSKERKKSSIRSVGRACHSVCYLVAIRVGLPPILRATVSRMFHPSSHPTDATKNSFVQRRSSVGVLPAQLMRLTSRITHNWQLVFQSKCKNSKAMGGGHSRCCTSPHDKSVE